jgi:hypothetical protein
MVVIGLLLIASGSVGYAPKLRLGQRVAARPAAALHLVASATDDDTRPLFDADALRKAATPLTLGGRPVEVGDGVLVNDDASGAWWRASIQDVRPGQVFVHYTGCDNSWDEWFDIDSPKISRMDTEEQRKDDSAFQSDTIEEDIEDEALLEQYRQKRWDDNARWQLNTFAQSQLGKWAGHMELYLADDAGRMLPKELKSTACSCEARVCASNTIGLTESLPEAAAQLTLEAELGLAAFRPEVGNMAVASAFSVSRRGADVGGESARAGEPLLLELALGEAERRVRCKLLYVADRGEAAAVRPYSIAQLAIVREVRGGGQFIDGNAGSADLDGTPGRGLYDPPPGDKSGYISLYLEGGMTLAFPTSVAAGAAGVISLDWIAGSMRYQIDRKWKVFDGSLSSLELTEIRKDDAEIVPPSTRR